LISWFSNKASLLLYFTKYTKEIRRRIRKAGNARYVQQRPKRKTIKWFSANGVPNITA
jgi:hypothetical protein